MRCRGWLAIETCYLLFRVRIVHEKRMFPKVLRSGSLFVWPKLPKVSKWPHLQPSFENLTIDKHPGNIYTTLSQKAENKLNRALCQELIRVFHTIHRELGSSSDGAVITRGNSNEKFWCMGIDLGRPDPWSDGDGFYPARSFFRKKDL